MNRLYQSKGIRPLITTNSDFVLLQSGPSHLNSTGSHKAVKHLLFDAGTSSFETSLYWFTCAYLQVSSESVSLYFSKFVFLLAWYVF